MSFDRGPVSSQEFPVNFMKGAPTLCNFHGGKDILTINDQQNWPYKKYEIPSFEKSFRSMHSN